MTGLRPQNRRHHYVTLAVAGSISVVLTAASGHVQTAPPPQLPGITRTDLQRHDLSTAGREAIQVRVDVQPGEVAPKHTHPGEEIVYVLKGSLEYQVQDKPPVTLKAGAVLFIPAEAIHAVKYVGAVRPVGILLGLAELRMAA